MPGQAPIPHGYADFNRASAESDVVLIQETFKSITASFGYPVLPTANSRWLFINATALAGHLNMFFAFYGDQAATIFLGSHTLSMRQNDIGVPIVPVLGPYVLVTVNLGSISPVHYSLMVSTVSSAGGLNAANAELTLASFDNTAIGAGGTFVFDSGLVMNGPVYWNAFVTGGNWVAKIHAIDENGVDTVLDVVNSSYGGGAPRALYLPSEHIEFTVFNGNAAPETFNLFASRDFPR